MNEYIPYMPQNLYEKIMKGFNVELLSAYPEVNIAYEALANFINCKKEQLLLTCGADMAIKLIFETFCSSNDVVATCSPTFAMYKIYTKLLNCKFKEVYSDREGFFTKDKLMSLIYCGAKIIIIANPNGVTGHAYSLNHIKDLLQKAEKKDILVVIDETYADFGNIDMSPLFQEFDNLIIVRSFSKNLGMAGVRIGYILSGSYFISMIEKFRPMIEINSLAVVALKAICSDRTILENAVSDIVSTRKYFSEELIKLGYKVIEQCGNFVLIDFKYNRKLIEHLMNLNKIEYRTLNYPLENYIRITIAKLQIMRKVLEIIKNDLNLNK